MGNKSPGLSPSDKLRLEDRKIALRDNIISLKDARQKIIDETIPANDEEESTNRKMWDFYHLDIIGNYEVELEAINGSALTDIITETDFTDKVDRIGRFFDDTFVEQDVLRIDQFDGTPITVNADHEVFRLPFYVDPLSRLQTGLLTTDAFSSSSTNTVAAGIIGDTGTINFAALGAPSISVGEEFIASDGTNSFIGIVDATNVIDSGSCAGEDNPVQLTQAACVLDNGVWTPNITSSFLDFTFVTPLASTMAASASVLGTWAGFNNTERTAQVSATYQEVMNHYINVIDGILTPHIAFLQTQFDSISTNKDPNQLDASVILTTDALAFYTSYKASIDISDAGITLFETNNTARDTFTTDRPTDIATATTTSYYDKRYNWSIERAGNSGTMIVAKALVDSIARLDVLIIENEERLEFLEEPFT